MIFREETAQYITTFGSRLASIVFFDQQTTPMWSVHSWHHQKKIHFGPEYDMKSSPAEPAAPDAAEPEAPEPAPAALSFADMTRRLWGGGQQSINRV